MTVVREDIATSIALAEGKIVPGIDFYWNAGNRACNVNEPD